MNLPKNMRFKKQIVGIEKNETTLLYLIE